MTTQQFTAYLVRFEILCADQYQRSYRNEMNVLSKGDACAAIKIVKDEYARKRSLEIGGKELLIQEILIEEVVKGDDNLVLIS